MASYKDILNGTLQNLGSKVREVADAGGVRDLYSRGSERAKAFARVARLTLELNGETEELRKVYAELGRLFFEQAGAAPDPLYAGLFSQAEQLRAQLREKEAEIRSLREEFEAAQAEKSGEIEVEIQDFEQVVSATESDGKGE